MSGKELLALATVMAWGLQSSLAADVQSGKHRQPDALRAIDRSPILLARAGKASVCGKCGANSCGSDYMSRVSKKHTAQMKRLHKAPHSQAKKNNEQPRT